MVVVQKEAAYAAAVRPDFYAGVSETGHDVGTYLHSIQFNALGGLFKALVENKITGRDVNWFFTFFASLNPETSDRSTIDNLLTNYKKDGDFKPVFAVTKNLFLYDPLTVLAAVDDLRGLLYNPSVVEGAGSEVLVIKGDQVVDPDKTRAALSALGKLSLRGRLPLTSYSADWFTRRGKAAVGYPTTNYVGRELAEWSIDDPSYAPVRYEAPEVLNSDRTKKAGGWADTQNASSVLKPFTSICGPVRTNANGEPLNPVGRTGIAGRGSLGKWGENVTVDRLLTRVNPSSQKIEMAAIQRLDGTWAHPGGFVDDGESVVQAVLRESQEEIGVGGDAGQVIYRGIVADPRTTDNAWIATYVYHNHIQDAENDTPMIPGSDAQQAAWKEISPSFIEELYASHGNHVLYALDRIIEEFGDDTPSEAHDQVRTIMRELKK
jgi:ADP-ribose pyrophosphatase